MGDDATVHVFGIRHHGPGSARSLRDALAALRPDCVLIEGPPDAGDMIPLVAKKGMKPPVALLVYAADEPRRAVYYPFAAFSPEWQAIRYGVERKVPVRFMDLPQAHQLTPEADAKEFAIAVAAESEEDGDDEDASEDGNGSAKPLTLVPVIEPTRLRRDPLAALAEAAGYEDSERWWERMVEHRRDATDVFAAILEAMAALREKARPDDEAPRDRLREAYMRRTIRAAQKEGYERIAVVCGAWHAPVLVPERMPSAAHDDDVLKDLPKAAKVLVTWVPWTYGRLTFASGYGAGVHSPGWYHHLWECAEEGCKPEDVDVPGGAARHVTVGWMAKVARFLRDRDLDASSASVIESVRLAESLAAMRDQAIPGLGEMTESALTVLLHGNDAPLRLIHDKLIVGERLGDVPDDVPAVPLQADLAREQKRLRLSAEPTLRALELDLRKETDLDRSRLLHRLNLLGVPWGKLGHARGKGTFKESWALKWEPEFVVSVIEAGVWGNTVADATAGKVRDAAAKATNLPALTELLDRVLLADLPDVVDELIARVQTEAAVASDVSHLMDALPPLANILRYGNVRKTDAGAVAHVVDGLVARVCVGLPIACGSLNDDAARDMLERVMKVHGAVQLLQNDELTAEWQAVLRRLADSVNQHGLIAGRSTRLLLDGSGLSSDDAATRLSLALSAATEPAHAAAWVEGFLAGSGALLLHDERVWAVLDEWVTTLTADTFTAVLPLVRRTFATFEPPERRQMGELARRGAAKTSATRAIMTAASAEGDGEAIDVERARRVLPLLKQILGV